MVSKAQKKHTPPPKLVPKPLPPVIEPPVLIMHTEAEKLGEAIRFLERQIAAGVDPKEAITRLKIIKERLAIL